MSFEDDFRAELKKADWPNSGIGPFNIESYTSAGATPESLRKTGYRVAKKVAKEAKFKKGFSVMLVDDSRALQCRATSIHDHIAGGGGFFPRI